MSVIPTIQVNLYTNKLNTKNKKKKQFRNTSKGEGGVAIC